MKSECPSSTVLLAFLDGELTENRAADLREHLSRCSGCAAALADQRTLVDRIAAPIPAVPAPDALATLMRRVDAAGPLPAAPTTPRWRAPLLGGLAVAATLALVVVLSPRGDRGDFQPRGARVEWSRKIGVELHALDGSLTRLVAGGTLAPRTPVVGSYSNVDTEPAYLLAFALDGAGETSWLYPAFVDPATDPESVRLDPSTVQRAFREAVVLDALPSGPIQFVFVVTREPLRVSSVEALPPHERSPAALRARFPSARVDVLSVRHDPIPAGQR